MRYSKTHEWISPEGMVGISQHALNELGEIVHVELPKVGERVEAGNPVAVVESTKAAADIHSPVSGVIAEVNPALQKSSALLNASPEMNGWLFQIAIEKPEELDDLLLPRAYAAFVK